MKSQFLALALIAFLPALGCKKSSPTGTPPAAPGRIAAEPPFTGGPKTSFQEVTAQLDPGGSLFLYLSAEQWLAGLSTNLAQLGQVLTSLPGPMAGQREEILNVAGLLSRLVKSSGLEAVTGVGASAAPVGPEIFRSKLILHRPSGEGRGLLWTMFGRAPHALGGQSLLPAHTAMAAFTDLDLSQLWQTLERELKESNVPKAAEIARGWPEMFEQKTKMPWAELLASLGGEVGILLTLDEANPVEVPIGGRGGRIEMPAPAFLAAVKVKNDLLFNRISGEWQANPRATMTEEDGLKICAMPLPMHLPVPAKLVVATSGDYFYFATSVELVRSVQAVRHGKQPGLKSAPAFKELAQHLPAEGNQFIYVSKLLGETFVGLQREIVAESGMEPEQANVLQGLFGAARSSDSMAVCANGPTGWQAASVGHQDSAMTMLLAPTVGVTAVGAGLLLPALAKAKAKAQSVSSVNQVKQLCLAAIIYANDHDGKFPRAEAWCDDLKANLGNAKVYKASNDPSPGRCSYAFNAKLGGLNLSKVDPAVVLFFETDGGWNQHGGRELLLPRPRPGTGTYVIGLSDGSVQMVSPSRVGALRWEP